MMKLRVCEWDYFCIRVIASMSQQIPGPLTWISRTFQDQDHLLGISRPGNFTKKNPGLSTRCGNPAQFHWQRSCAACEHVVTHLCNETDRYSLHSLVMLMSCSPFVYEYSSKTCLGKTIIVLHAYEFPVVYQSFKHNVDASASHSGKKTAQNMHLNNGHSWVYCGIWQMFCTVITAKLKSGAFNMLKIL